MFYIDQQTIDYLTLTGRDADQVKLVETYAKVAGLWADALTTAKYSRTLSFDLSSVVRTMAGRPIRISVYRPRTSPPAHRCAVDANAWRKCPTAR